MGKRKREDAPLQQGVPNGKTRKIAAVASSPIQCHIQVIAGSYERVLHGIIAAVPAQVLSPGETKEPKAAAPGKENISKQDEERTRQKEELDITFADSFLFNAHASAIRCLALSPIPAQADPSQKVLLATGSTDERINLYNLSSTPPVLPKKGEAALPSLSGVKVSQNASNKELGSLLHHASSLTALYFPTRSKLISASEDNTIAISRTRDWTVLSTIKAPTPKPIGRPSGDTAAPGEVPAGINDFAVHPSMKLMLSVGKGEKCMRLWNLVTGKKAGVLNFEKDLLQQAGEGKYGTGEGRRILWDKDGEEFVVAFERGCCVYDIDCEVKSRVVPSPPSKVHQLSYVPDTEGNVLAVSTEDGRILFFETEGQGKPGDDQIEDNRKRKKAEIPHAKLLAQMGGRALGISGRIKDFTILSGKNDDGSEEGVARNLIFVTGSSDGTIRLWSLSTGELDVAREAATAERTPQVGHLLAQYETGNRITCLKAFVMNERTDVTFEESEPEFNGFGSESASRSEGSDSDDNE
jgi:protein MAK11